MNILNKLIGKRIFVLVERNNQSRGYPAEVIRVANDYEVICTNQTGKEVLVNIHHIRDLNEYDGEKKYEGYLSNDERSRGLKPV